MVIWCRPRGVLVVKRVAAMSARGVLWHCLGGLKISRTLTVKTGGIARSSKIGLSRSCERIVPERIFSDFSKSYTADYELQGSGRGLVWTQEVLASLETGKSTVGAGTFVERTAALLGAATTGGARRSSSSAGDFFRGCGNRLKAKQFSTIPIEEESIREIPSAEGVISVETVVTETDCSVQELVSEIEETQSPPILEEGVAHVAEAMQAQVHDTSIEESSDLLNFSLPDNTPTSVEDPSPQLPSDRPLQMGRLYVGGLPYTVVGESLKELIVELFGKYGHIKEIMVAQHRHQSAKNYEAGRHRGFAFVEMETPEEAQAAIENLNGTTLEDRLLSVSYALKPVAAVYGPDGRNINAGVISRCKVFVGNLRQGITNLDLVNRFSECGNVVSAKVITELHTDKTRGFGFVTFKEEEQALKAVKELDGSILEGCILKVNIARYPQGY